MVVPEAFKGQRVDVVLAQLYPEFSRSQLTQWLKEGFITINQVQYKPKEKVLGGEFISLQVDLTNSFECQDTAEPIPLTIVYEDDSLLILNKPSGLVVHPGAGNPKHTLVNALLHYDSSLQNLPRAGIIHRLDKDTTGLLIVAKTLESYTALVRQMQARTITRFYKALVFGHIIAGARLTTNYGRHPKNRLKMAVCKQGKEATTIYSIVKHYQQFTLLDVRLLTGRTHQIRVHMEHIHHPIVGDPLYGGLTRFPKDASKDLLDCLQGFRRQALHASLLSLQHPVSQEELTFDAPLPDDFKHLLMTLDDEYA